MILPLMALIVAAVFTGAAVYINVVEQPARLQLEAAPLLRQWKTSYQRGFAMQASLAVLGGAIGLAGWWAATDWRVLAGSLLLLANWPYTLLAIMPVNRKLASLSAESPGDGIYPLVRQWGGLHAGRSGLGAAATILFAWSLET